MVGAAILLVGAGTQYHTGPVSRGQEQVDETGALVTNDDGEVITPHDYIVKKVAKSLNSVSVAISKVTVSG